MNRYRKYFTLLERDRYEAPWRIGFGDYERKFVKAELDDRHDHGVRRANLMIITTDHMQVAVNDRVALLNRGKHVTA